MKKYGGEVGPQEDLEVAHEVLRNELQLLQSDCLDWYLTVFRE